MTLSVVDGPAITWITPPSSACAAKKETLGVLASDTSRITGVAFLDGARKVFKLVDALEDSDDVQNVYTNVDLSDQVLAALDDE